MLFPELYKSCDKSFDRATPIAIKKKIIRDIWNHGVADLYKIATFSISIRRPYHEFVSFLEDIYRGNKIARTYVTLKIARGPQYQPRVRNDGVSYAKLLGLVKARKNKGQTEYMITNTGKRFLDGRGRIPEEFLVFRGKLVGVSHVKSSKQRIAGLKFKRASFSRKKAAAFIAV